MSTICNRVSMQGFYTKNPLHGYVKAMIVNVLGEDGHRYEQAHPSSPLYVPFTTQGKKYRLQQNKAVYAEDITSEDADVLDRYWALHQVEIKSYDQERMNIIFKRMEESLEILVQRSVLLHQKKPESRRRFLGIFPADLRAGFKESEMYGTIGGKQLVVRIYAQDLPSQKGEFTVLRSSKSGMPLRQFNG